MSSLVLPARVARHRARGTAIAKSRDELRELTPRADRHLVGGRPAIFTTELAEQVIALFAAGMTIRQVESEPLMPSWRTIQRWLRDSPDFCAQYARARAESAERLEHEALDAARSARTFQQIQAARLLVDTIKWASAKRNPRVYGERVDATLTVSDPADEDRRQHARAELIAALDRLARGAPLAIDGAAE
jgi:hypothetical protein